MYSAIGCKFNELFRNLCELCGDFMANVTSAFWFTAMTTEITSTVAIHLNKHILMKHCWPVCCVLCAVMCTNSNLELKANIVKHWLGLWHSGCNVHTTKFLLYSHGQWESQNTQKSTFTFTIHTITLNYTASRKIHEHRSLFWSLNFLTKITAKCNVKNNSQVTKIVSHYMENNETLKKTIQKNNFTILTLFVIYEWEYEFVFMQDNWFGNEIYYSLKVHICLPGFTSIWCNFPLWNSSLWPLKPIN